jgi:EAL and modified HD-GYP domain-containing signal transduction protein
MLTPADTRRAVRVVRQPILDVAGRLFAYELLYRESAHHDSCTETGDQATARVLTDAIQAIGLATLTNGRPAFINFTRHLLVSNAATLLPPKGIVIEIREDVPGDPEVVASCKHLRAAGYALALDDFVEGSEAETLLPFVNYVKLDMLTTPIQSVPALVKRLPGTKLIAERVETPDMHAAAKKAGFRLFQGYYFCRPVACPSQALPQHRVAYLNLFAALNRPDLTIAELEDLVKRELSLTYRVLRSVNSAAFSFGREIDSIRQALVLLGIDHIRKWALVWSLAGLDGEASETVSLALIRARCCEILGTAMSGPEAGAKMFLMGLCSLLDALLNQPLEIVMADLQISTEVRDALLGNPGTLRSVLDSVIAYERADWDHAASLAQGLGLPEQALADAYAKALPWSAGLDA